VRREGAAFQVTDTGPIRIVIAGGGTAGWMVAAACAHFLDTGFDITLVESEEIGTVGVGEATIPQIRLFNQSLGLNEDQFLKATQGTFKLAIEFVDWLRPGHSYMHAFGDVGRDSGLLAFHHSWARAKRLGLAKDLSAYSLNNLAALAGAMQRGPARTAPSHLPEMPYAFHFDAGLYAAFLRKFAETRGVTRVEGRIRTATRNGESGDVAALVMESGAEITGDLFVDCSGFRGLLIEQTLETGYDDWSHWLPCNRAVAVPCTRSGEFTPYTRSTARDAGWQWRIPLQHRTGNGHVYCSDFISDDEATAVLLANLDGTPTAEPRPLKFVTGKRRKFWNRNVIAVGLASGFMEPLESTSIHLIQSAIARIMKMLPGRQVAEAERTEYNRQSDFEFERIRDFLILHYIANERDTPFWARCREMPIPDTLRAKIDLFLANAQITREHEELFTEVGWLQVMVGQGISPKGNHPIADTIAEKDLAEYMETLELLNRREVAQMPLHADFVAQHCAAPTLADAA
jgi:tryptophan 7-halogenase